MALTYKCSLVQLARQHRTGLALLSANAMETHNGNRYMFIEDKKTFQEARETCETIGMTLSSVKSAEENSFIVDHIEGWGGDSWEIDAWIGGVSDSTEPEEWRWLSEEETWLPRNTSIYQNWHRGQPNKPGRDNCMLIGSGEWTGWWDCPCIKKHGFICKTGKM